MAIITNKSLTFSSIDRCGSRDATHEKKRYKKKPWSCTVLL